MLFGNPNYSRKPEPFEKCITADKAAVAKFLDRCEAGARKAAATTCEWAEIQQDDNTIHMGVYWLHVIKAIQWMRSINNARRS